MRNPYYYFVPNNNYYQPNYQNPSHTNPNYRYVDSDISKNLLRPCIISESYCDYFNLEDKAPDFTLEGIVNGQPMEVSLSDYQGKWVLLFFYGSDFTFV